MVAVRRYFSRRCIGLHITLLVLLPAFAWLTNWQLGRAEGGNTLSWAYVFLWPAFGIYAIYTWWQLIHDQAGRVPGRRPGWPTASPVPASGASPDEEAARAEVASRPPGWALSGGRRRNVAIAAAAPIDARTGGRGERFTAQTPDEAARLAEYNRYLAELSAEDEPAASSGSPAGPS